MTTNVLAALTGSTSGGFHNYMAIASRAGITRALMHRVAVTLDILPYDGAVVTLLALCRSSHHESYFDIVMVGIVSALLGLVAVIAPGAAASAVSIPPSRFPPGL